MSVLKIRDENGNWVSVPTINSEVNEASIKGAIPSLIKCIGGANSPLVTLDGESIPIGRISTGSYVGTGTGITQGSVSLAFDFKPQMVLIKSSVSGNGASLSILLRPDTTRFVLYGTSAPINSYSGVEWTDEGVSFSSVGDYGQHMNIEGTTYNYVAIGLG